MHRSFSEKRLKTIHHLIHTYRHLKRRTGTGRRGQRGNWETGEQGNGKWEERGMGNGETENGEWGTGNGESLKGGISKRDNLSNGESLKRGISKEGNL